MLGSYVKFALAVGAVTAIYFALATFAVDYAFGVAPGFHWAMESFGRLAGSRIWAHSVHAVAVLAAAIPSALLLWIGGRPHAVKLAALAGVLTAVVCFLPSYIHPDVRPYIDTEFHVTVVIDSLKMVLILVLLTWLFSRLPSNYAMQRSSRVVTPLAGAVSGSDRLGSASGASTARRRGR
jgi:hypothetical protein